MTTINQMLAELENKAKAASKGPFHITHLNENEPRMDIENLEGIRIADEVLDFNAVYFCAANPQTVLTLIAIIKQQNEALQAVVSSRFLPPQANVLSTYIKAEQALAETERMIKEIK